MTSDSPPERDSDREGERESESASEPEGKRGSGTADGTADGTGDGTGDGTADGNGAEAADGTGTGNGAKQEPERAVGDEPAYADRCYRSPAALAAGVLLLLLVGWLGGDALVSGRGGTRWVAVAGLVFLVPLVIAFTFRPAVYAGAERVRVRNPFRTITVPWGTVEALRSGYSSEMFADGAKYQLWSIPVSLRARNRAARHNERIQRGASSPWGGGGGGAAGAGGLSGLGGPGGGADSVAASAGKRAPSDKAMDELRELAARYAEKPAAQGAVSVRWAYEIVVPAIVGAVALAVLLATH